MIENKISKYIPYSAFALQISFFFILLILVIIKAYRFSDLSFTLTYLAASVLITLTAMNQYIKKLKLKEIELKDKLIAFILMQLPSTIIFAFFLYVIVNVEYYFD